MAELDASNRASVLSMKEFNGGSGFPYCDDIGEVVGIGAGHAKVYLPNENSASSEVRFWRHLNAITYNRDKWSINVEFNSTITFSRKFFTRLYAWSSVWCNKAVITSMAGFFKP